MQESKNIVYTSYLITLNNKEFNDNSKIGIINKNVDNDNHDLSTKLYKKKKLNKCRKYKLYQ